MSLWKKAFSALRQMDWSNRIGFIRTHVFEWLHRSPKVGQQAPNVMLVTLDSGESFWLRDLIGEKPLVLVFVSLTCPPGRHAAASAIAGLYERWSDDADFLTVYVKEAHAEGEWPMPVKERSLEIARDTEHDGVCYMQPTTLKERKKIAEDFIAWGDYRVPVVLDTMTNDACRQYGAFPTRLYVIGSDGTIAYRGGRGPFEFNPKELAEWLDANVSSLSV